MVAIYFTWVPNPHQMGRDFKDFANELQDFSEPFERSIDNVMAPSLGKNFSTGGRPAWEPLAAYTVQKKGHGTELIDSGSLAGDAKDPNSWDIGSHEAELTGVPDYGLYQDRGFYNVMFNTDVVARQWALFQDSDIDGIEITFAEWIDEKFEETVR